MPNILGIGESALNAAQLGLATTGHNIANASTPGYTRQVVVQGSLGGQDMGGGFVGKGTQVIAIRRVYSEFLQNQMASTQTSKGELDTYYQQMKLVDNMLSDPTVGVSPALQDFFSGVQGVASDPSSSAARQTMLSDGEALAARFQTLNSQLTDIRQGINSSIRSSMDQVNTLASQISTLNDQIERALRNSGGQQPNDLLDQRDAAITELSKQVKVSVVKQTNSYDVYIGNGQPLVVGTKTFHLVQMQSPTDSGRMEIGYVNQQGTTMLDENAFGGGTLAGLFDFRSKSLDVAQNTLGRMAIALGTAFNAQQALGQDQYGKMGQPFFQVATPSSVASSNNTVAADGSLAKLPATITDPAQLSNSDYTVEILQGAVAASGGTPAQLPQYRITRVTDGKTFDNIDQIDGVKFDFSDPHFAAGDRFLVRPTVNGASADLGIAVKITDKGMIAAAAPFRTAAATGNTGSGAIDAGSVNTGSGPDPDLQSPVTITFTSATTYTVTGTGANLPAAGSNSFTYTAGAPISYNGWTVHITGAPAAGDSFSVGPNTSGSGDGRNAAALGNLQTALLVEGTTTIQGAYADMVNMVGNKAQELKTTSAAAEKLADVATQARDAESGVNLDEEAANLMRYQQAYQAAAKVMKTAQDLFQMLLSLG